MKSKRSAETSDKGLLFLLIGVPTQLIVVIIGILSYTYGVLNAPSCRILHFGVIQRYDMETVQYEIECSEPIEHYILVNSGESRDVDNLNFHIEVVTEPSNAGFIPLSVDSEAVCLTVIVQGQRPDKACVSR